MSTTQVTVALVSASIASLVTYALVSLKNRKQNIQEECEYVEHNPAGPEAQLIANSVPFFPFKGIPKFYDIGGFLSKPQVFQLVVDLFVKRYRHKLATGELKIDKIAGIDARGFILGPPIALALQKPFIMLRKKGKMPNTVSGESYSKEYAGSSQLSVQYHAIEAGENILIIDDLIATGGSMMAAIKLVKHMGANCVECACIVAIQALGATARFKEEGYLGPVWYLLDETILHWDGVVDNSIKKSPTGYVDDGTPH